jgi:NADH:ubiquinone oxidoreductase subunit D
MDFTALAVELLIGVAVPVRNKLIRIYRDKKKQKEK